MSFPRPRDEEEGPVVDDAWLLCDAWVLAAARVSGSLEARGGLFDLVAACDAVNQLIVSRQELEHALGMLVGAGLMVADEEGIAVTQLGRAVVAEAGRVFVGSNARRTSQERIAALLDVLRRFPATPVDFELDPATYEAACVEYRHTRWSEFRRTERRF